MQEACTALAPLGGRVVFVAADLALAEDCVQLSEAAVNFFAPDNIILLHLPRDRPELNPMENVWQYLRQNKLCARVGNSYDDILEACRPAWLFLINDPAPTRSIGTRDWAAANV